jgi:perosamine synthetase
MPSKKPARIALCEPSIGAGEKAHVMACLDSGWVSSAGPYVTRFEETMARRVGRPFAVAVVNGTSALHMALLALGIRPGEEVVCPALTFIAPANAIRYAGAHPVFIDADAHGQMDPAALIDFLEKGCRWKKGGLWNKATGRRVAALLPVHLLGHACDLKPILAAARKWALPVIEDASESLGADYAGRSVGAWGDLGCFSFNGNKVITTGAGGLVAGGKKSTTERVRFLTTQAKLAGSEYIHPDVGYNYRMSNLQASLGVAQLERLDGYLAAKRAIARRYDDALAGMPGLARIVAGPRTLSAEWMCTVEVNHRRYGMDARALLKRLAAENVESRPLWQPMTLSPAHKGAFSWGGRNAERLWRTCLSLPSSVGLTAKDQGRVIDLLRRFHG